MCSHVSYPLTPPFPEGLWPGTSSCSFPHPGSVCVWLALVEIFHCVPGSGKTLVPGLPSTEENVSKAWEPGRPRAQRGEG